MSTHAQPNPHRNILLLIADDLGKNLGCYGEERISTPNIDALASEGSLFTHAFTSTASCSNSRSVIYTGLHTHQSGQYGLAGKAHHFVIFDHVKTSPAILGEHGYLTGLIGKIHVGPLSSYPWHVRQESTSRDVAWVADEAAAFFEKSKTAAEDGQRKPFFLTVGYIDPHRDMTRGGFGNDLQFDARVKDHKYSPSDIKVPSYINDITESRFEFSEYFRSISRVDQGVGMILEKLKASGLEDDTLVIFLSDNGPPFVNSKTTLYDAGVRLPFIVRQPGIPPQQKGIKNPHMISYVDILPTFLDWADAKHLTPPDLTGQSILPILHQPTLSPESLWPHYVFGSHTFHEITNYWPTRFLRTRRYKYHRNVAWRLDFPFSADLYGSLTWVGIRNSLPKSQAKEVMIGPRKIRDYFFRPPEELYDLEADPQEVVNLAKDEKYQDLLVEMRGKLEEWQRRTMDPWLFRDGVSVRFIQHHLNAGMKVPERFDLDLEDLRTM